MVKKYNLEKTPLLEIYQPLMEDLWFREQLLSDQDTMSYNHNYGGTISFPKAKWEDWYQRWMNNEDRYYRYLKNRNGDFVGEIAYYQNEGLTMCSVLILAKERGKGYGTFALRMLCDIVKSKGIKELHDEIALDNPSLKLFLKEGFVEVSRNQEAILIKKTL